ncbi:deoxyribonuclease IV [Nocardioides sp. Kera G14]|uniref:deoxyribonuclease IV n=1 Tax=Nocardioides sp. Kera G14 TaxID=2884264 RepID=UPI001D102FF8|nr:deoxyribonuclease IV [Nocardioides sp. Kera G14]UDY22507.1 deoxyribonuclease IV [Nocardioides sp. Kera G14]
MRNPIGTHLKVGKGLVKGALADADAFGAETLQIFVGNPRGWALSAGKPEEDKAFRLELERRDMRAFVHAPYLVNLGSPTSATYEKSALVMAHNLKRAADIGADGVVMHTGSFVSQTTDADEAAALFAVAMTQVREALLPILDTLGEFSPWLLLEPTAGQGRSLCGVVDDLETYLGALDLHPKAGICLDTCHVFAAGDPLDEEGGATATLDRLVEIGGPERLRLIHANDSKDVRGANLDRHEKIGHGHIGLGAFRELFAHPATEGVPFILETPGSAEGEPADFEALRTLRAEVAAGPRA